MINNNNIIIIVFSLLHTIEQLLKKTLLQILLLFYYTTTYLLLLAAIKQPTKNLHHGAQKKVLPGCRASAHFSSPAFHTSLDNTHTPPHMLWEHTLGP